MPIYEYECPKCGEFEVTQRITEDSLKKCPTCRSKVKKLISNTSFQLKGSGWYITDYGRKDGGRKEKDAEKGKAEASGSSESSASEKSESKSESKSEAKPEAKSESPSKAKSEKKAGGVKAA